MTPVILNTMPTEDVRFTTLYKYNGDIWSLDCRIVDGVLEAYDTLEEDEWVAVGSLDETLGEGYEVVNYITYIEG